MSSKAEQTARHESFRHEDGRLCWCLPYELERDPYQLLYGWFYGDTPELRKCQREHGLQGPEDEGAQA